MPITSPVPVSTIATLSSPALRSDTWPAGYSSALRDDVGAVGALAQVAGADELVRDLAPLRPEHLVVGVLQRALVRGAEQVGGVELLVLGVEDRRLDGALEEVVRVAAEELVERVLARDVEREAAAATARAAPHLLQRGDGARERHADRGVQRADVDAELQRVGGHHAEQLAADEPSLELAPLLRGVAGAVGRDLLGERVVAARA